MYNPDLYLGTCSGQLAEFLRLDVVALLQEIWKSMGADLHLSDKIVSRPGVDKRISGTTIPGKEDAERNDLHLCFRIEVACVFVPYLHIQPIAFLPSEFVVWLVRREARSPVSLTPDLVMLLISITTICADWFRDDVDLGS